MVTNESQFETTVGGAIKDLITQIVGGKAVTDDDVRAALSSAQQKLVGGG
jgi:multiple sugar transport system substrate-binding protein